MPDSEEGRPDELAVDSFPVSVLPKPLADFVLRVPCRCRQRLIHRICRDQIRPSPWEPVLPVLTCLCLQFFIHRS